VSPGCLIWLTSNHAHSLNPLSPGLSIWSLGFGRFSGVFPQAKLSFRILECVFPQLELASQSWWRLLGEEASRVINLIVLHLEYCRGLGLFDIEYRRVEHLEDVPNGKVGERLVG
jgi:hypothetical protein